MIDSYPGSENRPNRVSSLWVSRPAPRLEAPLSCTVPGKMGSTESSHTSLLLSRAVFQGQPGGKMRKESENSHTLAFHYDFSFCSAACTPDRWTSQKTELNLKTSRLLYNKKII